MSSAYRETCTTDERIVLRSTLMSLKPFRDLRNTMPLQYVTAFMLVATEEGQNITYYAKEAGISQSLMVRHLADLGEVNRYHEEGMGLVEQFDDPIDKRFRLMRLSAKGKGIANEVVRAHTR
jgi:DNA-binding MarR family transcriptional regulator